MPFKILIPDETKARLVQYEAAVRSGHVQAGARLVEELKGEGDFMTALLCTKLPQIFAESAVEGNGSDWNLTELGLLGDISVAMEVTVFDDGRHTSPEVFDVPFAAGLVFVPGALLRSGGPVEPADWNEVVDDRGHIDPDAYSNLYARRLLPGLRWINKKARECARPALVTLPGLGCGQFAGPFRGQLGANLETALRRLLDAHGAEFDQIRTVIYDPYSECHPDRSLHGGIDFRVRPLTQGGVPQLSRPIAHAADDQDQESLAGCRLFSFVAWDHVSWPGNDFYGGARVTDDGVKAAATSAMEEVTGVAGCYSARRNEYLPPGPHSTWGDLVRAQVAAHTPSPWRRCAAPGPSAKLPL